MRGEWQFLPRLKSWVSLPHDYKMNIDMPQLKNFVELEFNKLKDNIQPICPQCTIPLLLKSNRSRTSFFWGCSNYPTCKCTSNYKG